MTQQPGERRERALVGFDERPTLLVPATSDAEAAQFPAAQVRDVDPLPRHGWLADVGYTVAFLLALLASARPRVVAGWLVDLGAPDAGWVVTATGVVAVLALVVVVVANLRRAATWPMFLLGGVVGVVLGVATGDSVGDTVVVPALVAAAAVPVYRSRRARRARWRRLAPILTDHRLLDGVVLDAVWHTTRGAPPVTTVVLTVGAPALPGRSWTAQTVPERARLDAVPAIGDPLALFVCPAHPEVAVLRPVL